jgi:cytoskeletal protein CcmA (bactofilin family)
MVFNRKQDPNPKDALPFQLKRPDGSTHAQPPQIPAQSPAQAYEPASIIGSDLSIEGQGITIRCQGLLTVNGEIQADVHSRQLEVGREAMVNGSVSAENVEVRGRVKGAIHGARVVLHETAEVDGDIHSQFLTIQQGASFDGRSRKVHDLTEVAPSLTRPGEPAHQQAPHQQQFRPQLPPSQPATAQPDPNRPQFGVSPSALRPN